MEKTIVNKKVLKSGVWYIFSTFLVRGIGLITTPIFTRILTKADFGLYNNYASWLSIITVIVTLNLEATLISARYDYEDRFDEYILSVLVLSSISSLIWFLIINFFQAFFVQKMGISAFNLNVMMVYLLFLPAVHLFQARERYLYHYKLNVLISIIVSLGAAILSIALVYLMPDKLTGRIIGYSIPMIITGTVIYLYFINKGKKVSCQCWKYALPICIPYIPHALSLILLNSMDRVMITKICGAEDNALYSLAYTCASIIVMLIGAMNSAYSPWLGEQLHMENYSYIKKINKTYISCFIFLAVGIILISPEIIRIMGGEAYNDGIWAMPPVAIGCVFQFLYCLYVNVEQYKKKTIGMAFASISAALINYILNALLIPRYGYVAASYTTLISYIWLFFVHVIVVHKLGYKEITDYKFITIICAASVALLPCCMFLYRNTMTRVVLIILYFCALGLGIYRNKDRLLKMIKKK